MDNSSFNIYEPFNVELQEAITKSLTSRDLKAIKTKQKLYVTALELFAQKGYDAVSVNEICRKAGYTKGSFYNSFKSKHDILLIQLKMLDKFNEDLFNMMPDNFDALEKMNYYMEQVAKKLEMVGCNFLRSLYLAELSPDSKVCFTLDKSRPLYTGLHKIIVEAQENNIINIKSTSIEIVEMLLHYIRGILFEWALSNGSFDLCDKFNKFIEHYQRFTS